MQLSTLFKSDMCKNVQFKIILACFRKVHLFRCVIIHEKYLIIILTVVWYCMWSWYFKCTNLQLNIYV